MAKVVSDALMIAVSIVIVVKASGGFTLPEGTAKLYFDGGIALLLLLWFGLGPALFFVAKKIARRAKDDENVCAERGLCRRAPPRHSPRSHQQREAGRSHLQGPPTGRRTF